jgi:NAD-dependent SIR2 family protein deacetylase
MTPTLLSISSSGRPTITRRTLSPTNRRTLHALLLLSSSSSALTSSGNAAFHSQSSSSSLAILHRSHHHPHPHHHHHQNHDGSRRHISIFSSSSSSSSESSSPPTPTPTPTPPLDSIDDLAAQLSQGLYKNIVVLLGAGASVNAGIPDFRTPGSGLYDHLQDYDLPYPEAIFDLDYFRKSPHAFNKLATSIWPGQAGGPKPTRTHAFLRLLRDAGVLKRIYTQNIDGLESMAGLRDDDVLVECHGHFRSASCIQCGSPMAADQYREILLLGTKNDQECGDDKKDKEENNTNNNNNTTNKNNNNNPTCQECGAFVKPDIVFFGEELPTRFQRLLHDDTRDCDLLLVVGTSLLVMPVAGIPNWVSRDCTRVLINRDLVGDFRQHHGGDGGAGNNNNNNCKDLVLRGDCDESIQRLCQLIPGWGSKLEAAYQEAQSEKQQ